MNAKMMLTNVTTGNVAKVAAIALPLCLCSDTNLGKRDYNPDKRQVVSIAGVETDPPEDVIEAEDLKTYLTQLPPPSAPSYAVSRQEFVELPHCLLKPKQSITLTLLLTGPKGRTIRRGKLLNGKIVEFDPENQKRNRKVIRQLIDLVTWSLVIELIGLGIAEALKSDLLKFVSLLITVAFIILFYRNIRRNIPSI